MADVQSFSQTDNQSHARVRRKLEQGLSSEDWPIQLKVALACRKLAAEGHALTLAGQVTVRHDADTYWTSSIRGGFANAVQSSVVRLNDTMETVEGDGIPNPGVQFHLWIYRKRPEIFQSIPLNSDLYLKSGIIGWATGLKFENVHSLTDAVGVVESKTGLIS